MINEDKNRIIYNNNTTKGKNNERLRGEVSKLKPDLWWWQQNDLYIIEITVPYGMLSDNNDENRRIFTLETRRKQKTEKYKELVQESEQQFGCKVRFSVIIESSLGALPKETISELRKFTMNKRKLNLLCRRIVGASFTDSMLIYYNLDFEKDMLIKIKVTQMTQMTHKTRITRMNQTMERTQKKMKERLLIY